MKHLLGEEGRELLAQLASTRLLLAFDFDGTLAPIVPDRSAAKMRSRTAALLGELVTRYRVAVISGRAKSDVTRRLVPARFHHVVGNHGLEPGGDTRESARIMKRCLPLLEAGLVGVYGVEVEDKRYSLAVHYRQARNKGVARASISAAIAALPDPMRVIAGKLVVNVVPASAPNKGDALVALRAQEQADVALYVGDDVTDEDVFVLDEPGVIVSARVGRSVRTAAPYYVRDQREIDALLATLVRLRPGA
ncbi:MAG: trehalose-phosphatase [Sandaracinus sp.]